MTISRTVYNQLFEHSEAKEQVIRLRPTEAKAGAVVMSSKNRIQMWTKEEHERFLEALEMYPSGPWKKVADHIGTKTPRQTMTHAQKYRQKIYRRQRGLRNQKRTGAEDGKVAVSPNGVADIGKTDANGNAAAHSGFGLLDILAYSAAAASGTPHPNTTPNGAAAADFARQQENSQNAQNQAPQQPQQRSPSPPAQNAQTPKTSSPVPQQSSPSSGVNRLCNNSHLPPLSEILHLRGSQVAQQ